MTKNEFSVNLKDGYLYKYLKNRLEKEAVLQQLSPEERETLLDRRVRHIIRGFIVCMLVFIPIYIFILEQFVWNLPSDNSFKIWVDEHMKAINQGTTDFPSGRYSRRSRILRLFIYEIPMIFVILVPAFSLFYICFEGIIRYERRQIQKEILTSSMDK